MQTVMPTGSRRETGLFNRTENPAKPKDHKTKLRTDVNLKSSIAQGRNGEDLTKTNRNQGS